MKDFNQLINTLKSSVATYDYFVDFKKVFKNVSDVSYNLNILNHLLGQPDFDGEFFKTLDKNPDVISVLPILLAVRESKINILNEVMITYDFKNNMSHTYYLDFVKKTGLIDLFYDHRIKNLVDYVTGIEVGLDSNGRKNRSGEIMSKIVERFLDKIVDIEFLKEATLKKIESSWQLKLSPSLYEQIINKRFDFVVKDKNNHIYLIETNYYGSSGSKLNETSRSYIKLALDLKGIDNISFIWITDGKGWLSTKNNLKEAYDQIEHLYNIYDLEQGILKTVFNHQ